MGTDGLLLQARARDGYNIRISPPMGFGICSIQMGQETAKDWFLSTNMKLTRYLSEGDSSHVNTWKLGPFFIHFKLFFLIQDLKS